MRQDKIKIGIEILDEQLSGGLKAGELYIDPSPRAYGKSMFLHDFQKQMIEKARANGYIVISLEMGLGSGNKPSELEKIRKMIDENPVGKTVTKYENLGGTIFPVIYHSNGIVTFDYPNELPKKDTDGKG